MKLLRLHKKIDTFDLSIMPFEDCCTIFAPPAPKTKPRLDKARLYEARLDADGMIERALAGIKITEIKSDQKFLDETSDSFAELL